MSNPRRAIGFALLLVLVAVTLAACGSSSSGIVGEWKGEYDGDAITMVFDRKGSFTMSAYGESIKGTYTVDTSTDPHQLDLTLPVEGTIETIFELVDANTLRFQNNFPSSPRPTTFDDYMDMERQ